MVVIGICDGDVGWLSWLLAVVVSVEMVLVWFVLWCLS